MYSVFQLSWGVIENILSKSRAAGMVPVLTGSDIKQYRDYTAVLLWLVIKHKDPILVVRSESSRSEVCANSCTLHRM